jgi:hypothetical protein
LCAGSFRQDNAGDECSREGEKFGLEWDPCHNSFSGMNASETAVLCRISGAKVKEMTGLNAARASKRGGR